MPAAFNDLVALKPTRGILSTAGVVPACRTLDLRIDLKQDLRRRTRDLECCTRV